MKFHNGRKGRKSHCSTELHSTNPQYIEIYVHQLSDDQNDLTNELLSNQTHERLRPFKSKKTEKEPQSSRKWEANRNEGPK